MKISFYGGARQVTGSNFLFETKLGERFLIDCGMFQGGRAEEEQNAMRIPYDPSTIDYLILTHAHIDHSGRIPLLVKEGFKGDIYCTNATGDLVELMLLDSAGIQESDAEWQTKKNERQGKPPVEPLYTKADVEKTLPLLRTYQYRQIIEISESVSIRFRDAGHILGSSAVEIWVKDGDEILKIVASGDLGMRGHELIRDPEFIEDADYLLLESTYGNSTHGNYEESLRELMQVIEQTTSEGGTVIIPSFAVGRTQELIYEMNKYYEYTHRGETNPVRIIIDSPMATRATSIFMRNTDILDDEAQELIRKGDNIFSFDNLHFTQEVEESMALNSDREPKVIISASGMATGGRVRHHLKHHLWSEKNAIIFVGYQAVGTLGRIIQDGAKEVKILGETIASRAKIYDMEGFSAHADKETLLNWVDQFKTKPKKIILVHGEDQEMKPFAEEIKKRFNIDVVMPEFASTVILESNSLREIAYPFETEEEIERLKTKFVEVQAMMQELESRDLSLDTVDENRYQDLETVLLELRSALMDLNMLTGK